MEQRVEPCVEGQADRKTRSASGIFPARPPLADVRCLVIEDEPAIAYGAARMLKNWGARPSVVGTVVEALDALMKRRWDLLLVDLKLPDGNGETVVREAKRLRPRPAVVVMSGVLDSASQIRLQLHGALVSDKVELSTHLLPLSLEALRRARFGKRRPSRANLRVIERPETIEAAPSNVSQLRPGRLAGESSTRDAALAEFGARARFSPKEQQIFVLSLRGFTDKDIAERLGVAHGTVRTNWVRMARKIGATGGEREVLKHFARWCAEGATYPSR